MTSIIANMGVPQECRSIDQARRGRLLDYAVPVDLGVAILLIAGSGLAGFAAGFAAAGHAIVCGVSVGVYLVARQLGLMWQFAFVAGTWAVMHPAGHLLATEPSGCDVWMLIPWLLLTCHWALTSVHRMGLPVAIAAGIAIGVVANSVSGAVVLAAFTMGWAVLTAAAGGEMSGAGGVLPWRYRCLRLALCVLAACCMALMLRSVTYGAPLLVSQPLAGLDRSGVLTGVQRLPPNLGASRLIPYMGWSMLALAAVAINAPTKRCYFNQRGVAGLILFSAGLLWLMRDVNFHQQLRSLLTTILLRENIPVALLNRIGLLVIVMAGVVSLIMAAGCRAVVGRRRMTVPAIFIGCAAAMLWWRSAPVDLFGETARFLGPAVAALLPGMGLLLAIAAGAGMQRVWDMDLRARTRVIVLALAVLIAFIDLWWAAIP